MNTRLLKILSAGVLVVAAAFLISRIAGRSLNLDVAQLPSVKTSETVRFDDGDSFDLTAELVKKTINGQELKMLGYNGSIPGPVIEVRQGSTVTVNFTNNTDIATTIHPHGVRVANAFDGVPDVTQKLIEPGASFTYILTFPDPGIYWYHPHFREDYAQELGLYGAFLVRPQDSQYWSEVNGEQVLFVDDILLGAAGVSFDEDVADHTLMGRFGNVMLVNGETNYRLEAKAGDVQRYYIANSANTRPFRLEIPKAKVKLVGADNGRYERETFVQSVLLGPSERAVVEVYFPEAGVYTLQHRTPERIYPLAVVEVSAGDGEASFVQAFNTLRVNAGTIASIDPFRQDFNRNPDKTLRLTIDMQQMGGSNMHQMHGGGSMMNSQMMMGAPAGGIEWEDSAGATNAGSTSKSLTWKLLDDATGRSNMDINDWKFSVGDHVKVRIVNDAHSMHPMQHPIHFHGQRFLVVSRDGKQETNLVWKDTVFVSAGQTVDLIVDMSNPGTWMVHCHIAEHLEAGMMTEYVVEPR